MQSPVTVITMIALSHVLPYHTDFILHSPSNKLPSSDKGPSWTMFLLLSTVSSNSIRSF